MLQASEGRSGPGGTAVATNDDSAGGEVFPLGSDRGSETSSRLGFASLWQRLKQPPWRTFAVVGAILGVLGTTYLAWSPGERVTDGSHDRRTNGIWLRHGWLGDDAWFAANGRNPSDFRSTQASLPLAHQLASHGMAYVFPHLCPCTPEGALPGVDEAQTARFLDDFTGFSVVPWVGGVLGSHCFPESPGWRQTFVTSAVALLDRHPRLAGVQVNIEPLPSGSPGFLLLLEELRAALPTGKILAVAAYPPPTRWHPFVEVHWDDEYFRAVAQRADLMVPMLYDTAIRWPKLYERVVADWTAEVLRWSDPTPVLLGVPAYEDAETGYHKPRVENLHHALRGVHAGLQRSAQPPGNYAGIAVYCAWEMNEDKWATLRREFERFP